MTGRYVAFEGIEGAGKSTVAQHLADHLRSQGSEVLVVREPGGTKVGEGIRSLLLNEGEDIRPWTEALLFAASRAQLAADVVRPALESGAWVISDRTVYSSLAYQGGGRGLGVAGVRAVNEAGLGGVWPDHVILLRLDPEEGLRRQDGSDRIGSEGLLFHRVVAATFDDLASEEPDRFVVIDATRKVELVVDDVLKALGDHLGAP